VNLERVVTYIRRTASILLVMALVLTIVWFISFGTHLLDLPDKLASSVDGEQNQLVSKQRQAFTPQDISSRTRGKSIFRTNRALTAQVVDDIGRYLFRGVAGRTNSLRAYFRDTKMNKTLSKSLGENIGPFRIVEIQKGMVVVERGSERFELHK